jgi:hypothetical protein
LSSKDVTQSCEGLLAILISDKPDDDLAESLAKLRSTFGDRLSLPAFFVPMARLS